MKSYDFSGSSKRRTAPSTHPAENLESRVLLTDLVVTSAADNTDVDGLVTLREAIEAANSNAAVGDAAAGVADGDTITFAASLSGQTITLDPTLGELVISDDVSISQGDALIAPTISTGIATQGIFRINTPEFVSIDDVTLTGSRANRRGGAVTVSVLGDLHMDNVTFDDNRSFDGGAVLLLDRANFVGSNLTFTDNEASLSNASDGNGGAIVVGSNATAVISDSTFSGNRAGRSGGAIDAKNNARVILSDVTFDGDIATVQGGAIRTGMNATLRLEGGITFDNHAAADGGALYLGEMSTTYGDGVTVSNSEAIGGVAGPGSGGGVFINTGARATFVSSTFDANDAVRAGGAIEVRDGVRLRLDRTDLTNNDVASGSGTITTANPGNGGALHVTGAGSNVVLIDATVTGNTAESEGGGLWNDAGSLLSVRNSTVSTNVALGTGADNGGGGIFNNGGNVEVTGISTLDGNTADEGDGSGGAIFSTAGRVVLVGATISNNSASRAGGGLEVIDGEVRIVDSLFDTNQAVGSVGNGGGLHVTGMSGTTVTIEGRSIFTGNTAGEEGGGVWNQAGSTMTIRGGSEITSNVAEGTAADMGGGGVFNNGGTVAIADGVLIEGNTAIEGDGSGGGILSTGGEVTVYYGSRISTNEAARAGGGVEIIDGRFVMGNSTIADNITGQSGNGPGNGGGIHVTGNAGTFVRLTNGATVSGNTAASEGGGVWNQAGSSMTIDRGSRILDNIAEGEDADNGGGGVFNNGGTVAIANGVIIDGNTAIAGDGSGGGILSTGGEVTVYFNSRVTNNESSRAGGGVEVIDGRFIVGNSTIADNITGQSGNGPGNGGAIHVTGTAGTFVRVTNRTVIEGNTAENEGGGLWNQTGSTMRVDGGTQIYGNTSNGTGGGGIFNNGGTLDIRFFTTSIRENSAVGGDGGGIFNLAGGVATVADANIQLNDTDGNGGGIFNEGDLTITGAEIRRNEATDGGGVFNDTGATFTNNGSIVVANDPNDIVSI